MTSESNNPFRSLVGLRGVDTVTHAWVNDITGISTELVSDLAQPSDIFGSISQIADPTTAVWEGVHREAYEKLVTEIKLQLSENYDFAPVIVRTAQPQRAKPSETVAGPFLVGSIATIPYLENATINLNALTVFVVPTGSGSPNQTAMASVRVYDMDSQAMFYSAPHEFRFGANTIQLNQPYRTLFLEPLRLGVFVDVSQMWLSELRLDWGKCEGDYLLEGARMLNTVATIDAEKTYVSLDIEVVRSIEPMLTRYAKEMANAYRYLCGSLLMTEKLATPNLSAFTLSNVQMTERLESKLFDDFKRALRPTVRLLSNELQQQQSLTIPLATPNETTIIYGSYV
ncbi:hypothetical protein [Spirosoma oryzicola]|uniref:hypothetical protein n=1 Tax=Spirosoma oryzicola TaxID=2898794 RepID=UPI001E6473C4|nr:hypothetical protein [Spirosoma oryzicola]UHG91751.1 hypothetical protein LQ777_02365 [Spirosoma oryzicola]